jgi:hypothetical protein
LCVLAALFVWRHVSNRVSIPLEAIGVSLVLCALTYPAVLLKPSVIWWRVSHAIAAVNARILLVVLFFVALLPTSLVWRLVGKDPLNRRRGRWAGWTPYPARYRDRLHYQRMY